MTLKPYYAAEASSLLFKKTYVIYTMLKKNDGIRINAVGLRFKVFNYFLARS